MSDTEDTEELRQPHPSIRPLPEHNAPIGCKLAGHMDNAFFQDSDGRWILYWHDGWFSNAEKIQAWRDKK